MEQTDILKNAKPIDSNSETVNFDFNNINMPECIKNYEFEGKVIISYASTKSKILRFENCTIKKLSIKNETPSLIDKIQLVDCKINTISVYHSSMLLEIEKSKVNHLIFDYCNLSKIKFDSSNVTDISFETNSNVDNILITNESHIEEIDSKDADVNQILIHGSIVKNIHMNKHIGSLELFDGANIERFSIDEREELVSFLDTLKKRRKKVRRGTLSQMSVELRHQRQIVLAAFNQYVDDNKFQEMDTCLISLRKINCILERISTNNIFKKAKQLIKYIVIGKLFGWGVKITNPLITSVIIILSFALIYFFVFQCQLGFNFEYLYISLVSSTCKFFGINETNPISIIDSIENIEQIIGVIILTIFTGIIARKIIR